MFGNTDYRFVGRGGNYRIVYYVAQDKIVLYKIGEESERRSGDYIVPRIDTIIKEFPYDTSKKDIQDYAYRYERGEVPAGVLLDTRGIRYDVYLNYTDNTKELYSFIGDEDGEWEKDLVKSFPMHTPNDDIERYASDHAREWGERK